MKKYKNYILLGILIVLLVIAVIVISDINTDETDNPENDYEVTEIYSVMSDDIASVEINNTYGEYTVINGETVSVKNKNVDLDTEKLKNMLSEVSSAYAFEIASEGGDYKAFGLDMPKGTAVISLNNDEKINVHIGDATPTSSGRYMKLGNSDIVYIISESASEVFLRKLDYYRNTVLFTVDVADVKAFEFTKDGNRVAFVRNSQTDLNRNTFASFNMVTPYKWDAEGPEIEKIIGLMNQLEIKEYVDDNPQNPELYGLRNPSANIIITKHDGSKNSLYIGKNKDSDIYISVDGKPNVYLVEGAGFEFLSFEPGAFLQQFVSLRLIDQLSKFRYIHNDIDIEFDIKKIDVETHDIKVNGKLVDEKSFKAMYTEIISMTTGGILNENPTGNPVLSYEFTYLDGEKEIVKFYIVDERKIAVVLEGASVFYVDSSQFEKRINVIDDIIKNNF